MYCKQCHYPLIGLDRSLCPECGRGFNIDDKGSFDTYPWRKSANAYQWIRFMIVLTVSGLSAMLVWGSGEVLLDWHYGRATGPRLAWSIRRHIDQYDELAQIAGMLVLSAVVFAVLAMRRSKLPAHVTLTKIARCVAFAAATWWIGWYLAIHYGYLLFPI